MGPLPEQAERGMPRDQGMGPPFGPEGERGMPRDQGRGLPFGQEERGMPHAHGRGPLPESEDKYDCLMGAWSHYDSWSHERSAWCCQHKEVCQEPGRGGPGPQEEE